MITETKPYLALRFFFSSTAIYLSSHHYFTDIVSDRVVFQYLDMILVFIVLQQILREIRNALFF